MASAKKTRQSKRQKQPPRGSPQATRKWRAKMQQLWVADGDDDGITTGFSSPPAATDSAAEREAARAVVVPGASFGCSPTVAGRRLPDGGATPPPPPSRRAGSLVPIKPGRRRKGEREAANDAGATSVCAAAGAVTGAAPRETPASESAEGATSGASEESVEPEAERMPTRRGPKAADAHATDTRAADARAVMLSPVQDEKKVTPRKSPRSAKRRSLDATFASASTAAFSAAEVSELMAELYQEQEQDDRGMYSITVETVREQTARCERSAEVEELSLEDFRRLLTYGEVSVESVSATILPLLGLEADDVLYDLGCGTGKVLVQAVLQTKCAKAVGIELMQNRVQEGLRALERLERRELALLADKSVRLVQGDVCKPPAGADMSDATVVFINNVMFGPTLMLRVMQQLESIPNLKRVVTLRKVCERHRPDKCRRAGNLCAGYVDPPEQADILVSWASKTQVYMYERLDHSIKRLSLSMQAPVADEASAAASPAAAAEGDGQIAVVRAAVNEVKRSRGRPRTRRS